MFFACLHILHTVSCLTVLAFTLSLTDIGGHPSCSTENCIGSVFHLYCTCIYVPSRHQHIMVHILGVNWMYCIYFSKLYIICLDILSMFCVTFSRELFYFNRIMYKKSLHNCGHNVLTIVIYIYTLQKFIQYIPNSNKYIKTNILQTSAASQRLSSIGIPYH